jgi:hypothetical protein
VGYAGRFVLSNVLLLFSGDHVSVYWIFRRNACPLPVSFARQAGASAALEMFTLSLQCAGMAMLIAWQEPVSRPTFTG